MKKYIVASSLFMMSFLFSFSDVQKWSAEVAQDVASANHAYAKWANADNVVVERRPAPDANLGSCISGIGTCIRIED